MSEVVLAPQCCPQVGTADESHSVQRDPTAWIEVVARRAFAVLWGRSPVDGRFGTGSHHAESSAWVESVAQRLR
jgi:hypothetical protein